MNLDPPVGDPGAMRATSGRLALECQRLVQVADDVDRLVALMDYQCRAGATFRDEVKHRRGDIDGIVNDLQSMQRHILREAARVEGAQALCARLARLSLEGAINVDSSVLELYRQAQRLGAGGT